MGYWTMNSIRYRIQKIKSSISIKQRRKPGIENREFDQGGSFNDTIKADKHIS